MGAQVIWMFICFVAVVYLNFSTNNSTVISRAQLFLVAEALTELGLLLDSDVLQFHAEMAKFLVVIRMHFSFLKWFR